MHLPDRDPHRLLSPRDGADTRASEPSETSGKRATLGAKATSVWTTSGAEPLNSLNAHWLTFLLERCHALDTSPQVRVLKS